MVEEVSYTLLKQFLIDYLHQKEVPVPLSNTIQIKYKIKYFNEQQNNAKFINPENHNAKAPHITLVAITLAFFSKNEKKKKMTTK
jgi:hypothetical protein